LQEQPEDRAPSPESGGTPTPDSRNVGPSDNTEGPDGHTKAIAEDGIAIRQRARAPGPGPAEASDSTDRTPGPGRNSRDTVLATYREIAAHLGLQGPHSARNKVKREGWPAEPANHPADPLRIRVPAEVWDRANKSRGGGPKPSTKRQDAKSNREDHGSEQANHQSEPSGDSGSERSGDPGSEQSRNRRSHNENIRPQTEDPRSESKDQESQSGEISALRSHIETLREDVTKAERRAEKAEERAERAEERAQKAEQRLLDELVDKAKREGPAESRRRFLWWRRGG
jgi:hypothetical protein